MAKQSFTNYVKGRISGAGETIKNYSAVTKGKMSMSGIMGIGGEHRKLANKMMEKEYVSPTMGNQTWNKRRKETLGLIKQGKMKQARTNLQNLKSRFKEENL